MKELIAIALGGSLGAVTRFLVANGIYAVLGRSFPHGTLFVNVSGSFLMGLLTQLMLQRFAMAVEYRAAILVGFLGAYTTFSTFALETLYLFEEGCLLKAFLNIFLSAVLCLAGVRSGMGVNDLCQRCLSLARAWPSLCRYVARASRRLFAGYAGGIRVSADELHARVTGGRSYFAARRADDFVNLLAGV